MWVGGLDATDVVKADFGARRERAAFFQHQEPATAKALADLGQVDPVGVDEEAFHRKRAIDQRRQGCGVAWDGEA